MGERIGEARTPAIDVDALRRDLGQVIQRTDRFLWIWVLSLAALFVLDCVLLLVLFREPKLLAAIFTATGAGFAVLLTQMRRAWREKFSTETVIALLPVLTPVDLRKIVDQLLATWLKP
jgi:hypothetical protein